jgi:hypothetical protein
MKRSHGWQETSWGGLCDGREWKNGAGGGCRLPLLTYTHDKFTSPFQCMAWRRFRCRTRKWVKSNEHCKCCNTLHRREVRDTHTQTHREQTNLLHAGRNVTAMKCNIETPLFLSLVHPAMPASTGTRLHCHVCYRKL